jgi:hypothetical protein
MNAPALGWMVKDFADGWIFCRTHEEAAREAGGAGNLVAAVEDLYPVYRRERARLLSNARCHHGLAKRFSHFADVRGYLGARDAERRELARLRAAWAPIRAVVAKAEAR